MTDPGGATADAVVAALHDLGGQATSGEIQEKANIKKDRVNRTLRELESMGRVVKTGGGVIGMSARWALAASETSTIGSDLRAMEDEFANVPGAEDGEFTNLTGAPSQTPADDHTDVGGTDTPATPDSPHGDDVGGVAAWMGEVRPVPEPTEEERMAEEKAAKAAKAPKEPKTGTCTVCGRPMHKEGRSWVHDEDMATRGVTEETDHKATSKAVREPSTSDGSDRLSKGEREAQIERFLRENPDTAYGAGEVAKGINFKWSGTTGKILEKLADGGSVRRIETEGARGRKYQAA
jgi:hypothetical protein